MAGGPQGGGCGAPCREPSWFWPLRGPPGRCPVLLESIPPLPRGAPQLPCRPGPAPTCPSPRAQSLADAGLVMSGHQEGSQLYPGRACTCACARRCAPSVCKCVTTCTRTRRYERMLCAFCMCTCVYTRACKCELSSFAWATHLHVCTRESVLVFRRACWAGALECASACAHTRVCVDERVHVNVWMCLCARVCTVWPRVGKARAGGQQQGRRQAGGGPGRRRGHPRGSQGPAGTEPPQPPLPSARGARAQRGSGRPRHSKAETPTEA